MAEPRFDVVLHGASGFTGALTAEYLAGHAPAGTRWALAGRNRDKLAAVRRRLAERNPACAELELLHADAGDPASLRAIAEAAKVVVTTVGPYIRYGEALVAACAEAGTTYVDLSGEPEFVDLMWLRYHERAQATGARLVHSCGFDAIPSDLGALFAVEHLPEGVPIKLEGFVRMGGGMSGGTYASTIEAMGRVRQTLTTAQQRAQRERERPARPSDRRVKGVPGLPHRDPAAGGWVVPVPTIDPQTVLRSARALDRYGPDFSYSHYMVVKHLPVLAGLAAGATGALALAQLPPARKALLQLRPSGSGPSPERRAKAWFRVRMVGRGGGKRVVAQVSGGDPGYGETSKMLAESALCLAHDALPARAGQLTPAVAMGDALIGRLRRAGIEFQVLE
jgi:short subunit dehydrogenase-like uncharacterized protein